MSRRALVTGATGALGPALVHALADAGWQVTALVRDNSDCSVLPADTRRVLGSITDPDAVQRAAAACDVIFHLAARLHVNDPGPALAAEYEAVNVGGTRNVIAAAAGQGVRRIVHFSTIAVYGSTTPGQLLDESAPAAADSLYARTKREAEALVLGSAVPGVVLRLAAVYGSRIRGNYRTLLDAIARRRFVFIGDGANRRTLVHESDVAAAALLAASHDAAAGRVFNVTDGGVHTLAEIVAAMAAALGRPLPRRRIPEPAARAAAQAADRVLRALGRNARAAHLLDKLLEDVAVSGAALQRVLGFRPVVDLQSGWRSVAADGAHAFRMSSAA